MAIHERRRTSAKTGKDTTLYYAAVYDPSSEKHHWSKGFRTRREAVKAENELIRIVEAGRQELLEKKKPSFAEIAEMWLESEKTKYAVRTWRDYKYLFHKYLEPVFGDQKIDAISTVHLVRWKNGMSKKYGADFVNKQINLLCNVFNFAHDTLKVIGDNPMNGVSRLKVPHTKKTTWTEDQIAYFLAVPEVKGSYIYEMLVLSFVTGMRPGEVCGLLEDDLTSTGILMLHQGMGRFKDISDMKTERSHRPIMIPSAVCALLREYIRRRPPNDDGLMFVQPNGRAITPDVYSVRFRKLLSLNNEKAAAGVCDPSGFQYAELPEMRLYDARHSFATNMLMDGEKSKLVSEVMGNSVSTMEHHYAHLREQMHEEALESYSGKLLRF